MSELASECPSVTKLGRTQFYAESLPHEFYCLVRKNERKCDDKPENHNEEPEVVLFYWMRMHTGDERFLPLKDFCYLR